MFKSEREHEILKIIAQERYITVPRLSELLYISESSIRRDLAALESKGLVKRSYGGVELLQNASAAIPFSVRAKHNIPAKKIMAKKAVNLVKDGDLVFLDQSSSSFFVAEELKCRKELIVVTNNPEILVLLSDSNINVICSGGSLSRENRSCLIGEDASRIFSEIHADICFFSTKSLSPDGSLYDCVREEVCVRNAMLRNAAKKVFLCDSEKFDTFSGFKQCTLEDVDFLVSENEKALKYKDNFEKLILI